MFTNGITDLSPLAECKELKHLNICWNTRLRDLTPVYGCTQLERLWIGVKTPIPKDQIAEFKKLVPGFMANDLSITISSSFTFSTSVNIRLSRMVIIQNQINTVVTS